MSNLFINKFPNLIKEWNIDLNKNIDMNTITYSSHKKIHWTCEKKHNYLASLNNRTKKNGSKCNICRYDSFRIHDKKTLNEIQNYKPKINTTYIGDKNELYICKILLETNIYKNVKIVGNIGGNADIIILHYDNTKNYIQIKTLTKNIHTKNIYYMTNNKIYPDNMLIVMIDKEHKYFALDFAKNIKVKKLSLPFGSMKSKYENIMFTDIKKFINKLIDLIPFSSQYNIISDSISKEKESLENLENYCKKNNLTFERNNTNGNTIDGIINNLSFQSKFVSFNKKNQITYIIDSQKSSGRLNGKSIKKNYEENDFDIMIIEIGGTQKDPDKCKNNFCFIPKNILIEQNILKTNTSKGKKAFYICPPDYNKIHWSKKYWNNISIFELKKYNL